MNNKIRYKELLVKISLIICSIFLLADFIYKIANKISYLTKEKCIFYQVLPKFWFLVFEYFIEMVILIYIGVFIAVIIEKYFIKFYKIIPKDPITAFIYASLIPVCACSVIPLLITLNDKVKKTTLFTFIIAAPLLNPYIIVTSFNILGIKYGILRIVTSFILAVFCGYILGILCDKIDNLTNIPLLSCSTKKCNINDTNIYRKTYILFFKLLPYILISGGLGILLEYYVPNSIRLLNRAEFFMFGRIMIILVGIPFYFCNGAEILILRPFLHAGFSLGSAIAFSLTATSICFTSIIMMIKIFKIKVIAVLIFCIFSCSLILSIFVDLMQKLI